MNISFWISFLILVLLLCIIASLMVSLFFLVRDQGKTKKTVKALTFRIVLSFALFLLLFVLYAMGVISPHAILGNPPITNTQK